MRLTRLGSDYVCISEDNVERFTNIPRIHLIKMKFFNPTEDKIKKVLNLYPKTRRFVIEDNIRIYNQALKRTNKKFYVENADGVGFISFFRKNNKVLLNITKLSTFERQFALNICLEDILRNIEVIQLEDGDFEEYKEVFEKWSGNVIIHNDKYII
jgi:hypothetical protein